MLTLQVNETRIQAENGTTLFGLRARIKPDADIVILNGAVADSDDRLNDGDCVSFIRRGEIPSGEELDALMAARHTPGVHEKLKAAVVGIAGLGGLGSAIAAALARVGVGKLILADLDVVEPSNLNRQHYFVDQIGLPKTDATVSNLWRINPCVQVEAHCEKLTPDNLFPAFGTTDVMIEAFDRADQKAMLLQAFTATRPAVPFIGASGMAGYAAGEQIGVKKLGPSLYIVGDLKTGAQPGCGLMAPRVGIAAHMQANLALRLIVDAPVS